MVSVVNYRLEEILKILGEKPQYDGLHIYIQKRAIHKIPFSFPYRSTNYTVHFILKGSVSLELDLMEYSLSVFEFIVIPPNTVIGFNSISDDVNISTVSFSLDFALQSIAVKHEIFSFDFFASKIIKKLTVENKQWDNFLKIITYLEEKNSLDGEVLFRAEMISNAFNLFLYEIAAAFKKSNITLKKNLSRKEDITYRFFKLLQNNFKDRKKAEYYADKLNISTSHLSKLLKETTGRSFSKLTEEIIINEAKILLADPSLSILQITGILQFSDQSFFGKFFKKRVGVNPSEYRKVN